jgi:hypothetical protein
MSVLDMGVVTDCGVVLWDLMHDTNVGLESYSYRTQGFEARRYRTHSASLVLPAKPAAFATIQMRRSSHLNKQPLLRTVFNRQKENWFPPLAQVTQ